MRIEFDYYQRVIDDTSLQVKKEKEMKWNYPKIKKKKIDTSQ